MVKSSNGHITRQSGLRRSLTVPPRRGRRPYGKINNLQWLSLTWRIGRSGMSRFNQRSRDNARLSSGRQQLSLASEGGADGCEAAEPRHRSNMCRPCRQRQFPENGTSAHLSRSNVDCGNALVWLTLTSNASFKFILSFLLCLVHLYRRHLHYDSHLIWVGFTGTITQPLLLPKKCHNQGSIK